MDSPLLPTFRRPVVADDDPSALLADLSLASASSPLPSGSHSSSSQHGRSYSHLSEPEEEEREGEEEATPVKPKAKPRFSLFAQPSQPSQSSTGQAGSSNLYTSARHHVRPDHVEDQGEEEEEEEGEHGVADGEGDHTVGPGTAPALRGAEREEKLREGLYELRRMNEVFDSFLSSLEAARGHNERLAERVQQTSDLLDQYTAIMGQAEHTQRLVNNPQWTGAEDDAAAIAAEQAAKQALLKQQAEEAEAARQRAEAARHAEEQRAARAATAASGSRGGTRGRVGSVGRGATASARGRGGPALNNRQSLLPTAVKRPPSASSGTKTTTSSASSGLGGQYANVRSSGYGPGGRRVT